MPVLSDLVAFLERFAPPVLAESWDNVGLLVGDPERELERVMTCLTVTGSTAREAIEERAGLIVTHHPLPFRPLKRLTTASHEGRLLWELIGAGVAIFSPHTAFDSARQGINQQLAAGLDLQDVRPLVESPAAGADNGAVQPAPAAQPAVGTGRWGLLPAELELSALAGAVKQFLRVEQVQVVGEPGRLVRRVAVACGSAGELLPAARDAGCQVLVTGETRFHTCLEAEGAGVSLVLAGHYPSERFAVETLAGVLAAEFPQLAVWASRRERDPLAWL